MKHTLANSTHSQVSEKKNKKICQCLHTLDQFSTLLQSYRYAKQCKNTDPQNRTLNLHCTCLGSDKHTWLTVLLPHMHIPQTPRFLISDILLNVSTALVPTHHRHPPPPSSSVLFFVLFFLNTGRNQHDHTVLDSFHKENSKIVA